MFNSYYVKNIYNEKTKATQTHTGMHTKESSQRTFEIRNNNLDVRFERESLSDTFSCMYYHSKAHFSKFTTKDYLQRNLHKYHSFCLVSN